MNIRSIKKLERLSFAASDVLVRTEPLLMLAVFHFSGINSAPWNEYFFLEDAELMQFFLHMCIGIIGGLFWGLLKQKYSKPEKDTEAKMPDTEDFTTI